jgi:hypothetical protein
MSRFTLKKKAQSAFILKAGNYCTNCGAMGRNLFVS